MVSTWHFLNSESIWPLPHVLFAYHGYMYTRDWKSVLCAYYIYKSLELLLFALIGYAYYYYFPELVDDDNEWSLIEKWYREFNGNRGGYEIYNRTASNNYSYNPLLYNDSNKVESFDNCHLDCNDLFVGGSIQTILGILLGMVQAKLFSSKEKINKFHLITFWKDSFLKHDVTYFNLVKLFNHRFKKSSVMLKYGLWPVSIVLGTTESQWHGGYHERWENMVTQYGHDYVEQGSVIEDLGGTNDSLADRQISEENKLLMAERWYFRRFFWYRWLQITTMGFPATLFYSLKGSGEIKAGLIIYCFVSCVLLLFYKHANEKLYLNYITSGTYDGVIGSVTTCQHREDTSMSIYGGYVQNGFSDLECSESDLGCDNNVDGNDDYAALFTSYDHQVAIYFNNYEKFYILWIFTTTFMCSFQAIPILSSFYRVLLSTCIIVLTCVTIKVAHMLVAFYGKRKVKRKIN